MANARKPKAKRAKSKKSKSKSKKSKGDPVTEYAEVANLVPGPIVKALGHEVRRAILGVILSRHRDPDLAPKEVAVSPNELRKILDEGLSQISYHVKVLKDEKVIWLVRTEPRRGAVEHYYKLTEEMLDWMEQQTRWLKQAAARRAKQAEKPQKKRS